jgi:antitoxin (DNA-binding transcriptional repressor) of toxin-antitoxin stability system
LEQEMTTYTLAEAKARFSQVIEEAQAGNQVLVTKHGHPAALITRTGDTSPKPERGLNGFMKKHFKDWEMPEDFDRMCEDEVIALFEGGDDR